MRIIAGRNRGRPIDAPPGIAIRPTADRARQAVFDMLIHGPQTAGRTVAGGRVLDAFAGTGAMGLEALSRGAAFCWFIDHSPAAVAQIRANLARLGDLHRAAALCADALKPPAALGAATLVFLDAPYGEGLTAPAMAALEARGWLAPGAVVVVESGIKDDFAPPAGFAAFAERRFGRARFVLMRYAGPDASAAPGGKDRRRA